MSALAAMVMALLSGGPACERPDLMLALPQKINERALLDGACGADCVLECAKYQPDEAEPPQQLLAHYEGSFRCPGRLESIVSLFPCHDAAGMHGVAGTVVLMRAAKPRGKSTRGASWEQVGTIENTVLNGECKTARVGDRDVLICLPGWGPYQGITGQSLCVLRWSSSFGVECALRVEDGCPSGMDGVFAAEVQSWSVGAAAADGVVPVRVTVKRAECDGSQARTVEGVVLIDAAGVRLSPETVELFKKARVVSE